MIETVVESPPAVKQPRFCLRSLGPSATTMLANVGTPIGTTQSLLRHSAPKRSSPRLICTQYRRAGSCSRKRGGIEIWTQVRSPAPMSQERFSESKGLVGGRPSCPQVLVWTAKPEMAQICRAQLPLDGLEESCEYRAELTPRMPTQVSAAECL